MVYCSANLIRWFNLQWKSPNLLCACFWFCGKSDPPGNRAGAWCSPKNMSGPVQNTLTLRHSYLGTSESPPLNVVGSSSNIEEMSFPSGTDTRVYMTLSWTFLKRALKASCSESSWREKLKQQLRLSVTFVSRSRRVNQWPGYNYNWR